jgi:RHS repeat-associated protein
LNFYFVSLAAGGLSSAYNNRLQPCRISVKNTGTAPGSCTDSTNVGNVMDFTYGFSSGSANNGNVASITNNINTARSQTYTYDELNRVTTAKTSATSGTYSWGLAFTYDPWANLLSASVTQGSAYSFSVYADGSNRIHNTGGTFTYDAAGNLTADPVNSSYTYNAEGELTSAAGVTYTYDGDGNRVKKSSGKLYWYGATVDPMAESDASGNVTNEYIFLSGTRIAMLTLSAGTVNYYITDHLGSSHIVTNSSGTILDDSDFYPFGGERSYSSSSGNNYKFTGKERDTESGLDDFAARFYTSNYGRFLSPDDAKYMNPADPQSFNLYGYVANNPINSVDPTGHAPAGVVQKKVEAHGGDDPEDDGGEGAGGGESPADSNSGTGDANSTATGSDMKTYIYEVSDTVNGVLQPAEIVAVQASNGKDANAAVMAGGSATDLKGPFVADLKSSQIAALLDPNHKSSNSDIVAPGECVDLTKKFSGMGDVNAGHQWCEGEGVLGAKDIKPGTAIASFDNGRFPNKDGWNSGIYLGPGVNGSIWILDQWPARPGHPARPPEPRELLHNNNARPANNSAACSVILTGPWR